MAKARIENFDFDSFESYLIKKNIKQSELSAKIGFSNSYFSTCKCQGTKPSLSAYKLVCLELNVPEGSFIKSTPEPPKTEPIPDKQFDRIETQVDRLERKIDRIEMFVRSIQNENLALRQELLKLNAKK